jgi:hypothetical protein
MADFLTLKDYFLSRGYEPDVFGSWSGFRKTINNIQLSFFEIKKAKNKLIIFNGEQIKRKKILEGLKNRPVSHIVQLVLQAEEACASDYTVRIFSPRLNGVLPAGVE